MEWTFQGNKITSIPSEYVGFVYLITNTINGRMYVGQKTAIKKVTRPPLSGKKRKRITYSESNWKDYWGSSEELLQDIQKFGQENFKREIIHFCKNKGMMNYKETEEIFSRQALLKDEYYNNFVGCKIHGRHVK